MRPSLIIILSLTALVTVTRTVVHAQEKQLKLLSPGKSIEIGGYNDLNTIISPRTKESTKNSDINTSRDWLSYGFESSMEVTPKINQPFDYDPQRDQSHARNVLRRAIGSEVSRLIKNSELKEAYRDVSAIAKRAKNLISIESPFDDSSTMIAETSHDTGIPKNAIATFGLDSSNQLNPTIFFGEDIKLSVDPLSKSVEAGIELEF